MKQRMSVVATFNDLDKARAVKVRLEQGGIHARVVDERGFQRIVCLSKPLACDKVLVEAADFDKARQFLRAPDVAENVLKGQVCCLNCGSPDVEYPQFTRRSATTTFFGVLCVLSHLIDNRFYCRDCHYTWPVTETLRRCTNVLNWPSDRRGVVKQERG